MAFGFIIAIILIKYKPSYKVTISGEELGYIQNKEDFENNIKHNILISQSKNIDSIDIKQNPEYELKLISRKLKTDEDRIVENIEKDVIITYKYYEIALNNDILELVDTIEDGEEIINDIKQKNKQKELDLSIKEKYTQNIEEVKTIELEVAKAQVQEKINDTIKKQKDQQVVNNISSINGIKIAANPVSGVITSRYGVSSKIRKSTHTGLDIAAKTGTPINVVADGTVIFARYNGSYGNLVKVSHGKGVETWYAHTNKMYVKEGQKVNAGDTIATVGSTGNSTGAHLHLEIRIDNKHVNPQKYLYN